MTQGKVTILKPVDSVGKTAAAGATAAFSPADAIQALSTIVGAVTEHGRVKDEHRTAREAIRAKAAETRQRIAENRKRLDVYLERTFDNRDLALSGFLELLDKAVSAGDVANATILADRIADVVKSGPLIDMAKLQQQFDQEASKEPVFRIGKAE